MNNKNTNNINNDVINVKSESTSSSVVLYAGQHIESGSVNVEIIDETLFVTYSTSNGFLLKDVHLFVGQSLDLMPRTQNGNPKVGLFPYKANDLGGRIEYIFEIPLSNIGVIESLCGKDLYLAAHAVVYKNNSNGCSHSESAWADGQLISKHGSWATYFSYRVLCDITLPEKCQNAFAFGESSFIESGLTDNAEGWVINLSEIGYFTTPIYVESDQNTIQVGNLEYSYDGRELFIYYNIFRGYTLTETHLYASDLFPNTINPGQFYHQHYLTDASRDEFRIAVVGSEIYIIAHAVVCPRKIAKI
ncbi:MAG: hypothetical protein A2W98_11900 [Bacteroidetes bacterium GWF2_33_38]|nr:MAG: hypothetical protein A2W98_11900 [Bacteroidetes bacterium GWF2_33_38]OFY91986.1 MAG: hypothetical protein A2236_12030 [Bacteroidetes bacterium RIFOXYA2_FULL_33_7]OFY92469.1 MAG: hypothetical protein A2309_04305 [Bacteroidetes bacterium RIFOXYB2_FULL_35_7]